MNQFNSTDDNIFQGKASIKSETGRRTQSGNTWNPKDIKK